MTQNKNKKGIAKKALSISLVAAMLATSNVPVWASGFEAVDPAAEGFAVESAAPEAVDNNTSLMGVYENSDINASFVLPTSPVPVGSTITPQISLTLKETDAAVDQSAYGVIWKDTAGNTISEVTPSSPALYITPEMAGKSLVVYVYSKDSNSNYNFSFTSDPITIVEKTINDGKLYVNNFTPGYNGKAYTTEDVLNSASLEVWIGDDGYTGKRLTDNFVITTNNAQNAGDILVITATAKPDSGLSGSVSAEVKLHSAVLKKILEATVNSGVEYEYTGETIKMDPADVTVKKKKIKLTIFTAQKLFPQTRLMAFWLMEHLLVTRMRTYT